MADRIHEIESRGATVEAAVAAGLQRLGLERDAVTVTVVDEGSRGLLGIGSREAVVRIVPLPREPKPAAKPAPPPAPKPAPPAPKPAQPAPQASKPEPAPSRPKRPVVEVDEGDGDGEASTSSDDLEAERDTAVDVISELLDKMRVSAEVQAYVSEPDDLTGQQVNVVEINGDDLGVLIGPRGETLDALQFVSRLMVAHQLRRRVNFVVDVEGYRQRRAQALARLAERMADKVRQRQEPISLEPMTAYERRIIHMTLRDAPDVYTESSGEGKQRKVRIYPQK